MVDIISYVMGENSGKKEVILETDAYTFTDDGDGNIIIEEVS